MNARIRPNRKAGTHPADAIDGSAEQVSIAILQIFTSLLTRSLPMPIEPVAAAAITILVPYLSEAGKAFAKKFGENMAEKAGNLYQVIKTKFTGDAYAEQTLGRVEEKPDSEGRISSLEQVLVEKLQDDSDFADLVQRLIEEAKAADLRNIFALGDRSVAVGSNLQNSTVITGNRNTTNKNSSDKAPED